MNIKISILIFIIFFFSGCASLEKQRVYKDVQGEEVVTLIEDLLKENDFAINDRDTYKRFLIKAKSPDVLVKKWAGNDVESKHLTIEVKEYDTEPTTVQVWVNVKIIRRPSRGGEEERKATPEEEIKADQALSQLDALVRNLRGQ